MILASASITENSGHSDLGNSLFESVREIADRMLHTEAIDVKSIPFLVLVVSFFSKLFLCLNWRQVLDDEPRIASTPSSFSEHFSRAYRQFTISTVTRRHSLGG